MERKQFTFYRSFWNACMALPKKDRLAFLTAVCTYAFEEADEVDLTGGKQKGRKRQAGRKQTESKPKAKPSRRKQAQAK